MECSTAKRIRPSRKSKAKDDARTYQEHERVKVGERRDVGVHKYSCKHGTKGFTKQSRVNFISYNNEPRESQHTKVRTKSAALLAI